MKGAVSIALAAAIGNMLQGWDNGALAGSLLYIKPEFHLENSPTIVGLVVAAVLIGAVSSTLFAGPVADWLGRRFCLLISSILYCVSACLMLWSPSVAMLIASRVVVGLGTGLVVTISPIFISETAPSEIRGQLSTFPQLLGSSGLLISNFLVFGLSLTFNPSWRFMLGMILVPSAIYLALVIFYIPESPRWLVSKGHMLEAEAVLQRLRDKEDVSGELALLVEGLGVGGAMYEEWMLRPAVPEEEVQPDYPKDESQITLFSPEEGVAWIATPVQEDTSHLLPRGTSILNPTPRSMSLLDPMVSLIGSIQHTQEQHQEHQEQLEAEAEAAARDEEEPEMSEAEEHPGMVVGTLDEIDLEAGLQMPLLRGKPSEEDDERHHMATHGSFSGESVGIGSGWQLAWQWSGPEGTEGIPEHGSFRRVFLLQETPENAAAIRSTLSLPALPEDSIPAAALVGPPSQYVPEDMQETPIGPVMMHPAQTAVPGPAWKELVEPGVRRALVVGLTLQMLQQFSGINAVLYFIPQILQQAGADVLLAKAGLGADSASILGSTVVALLMMPCIFIAMYLMDKTGRRTLLLGTIPVLLLALVAVIISNTLLSTGLIQAMVSLTSVALYACSFVTGFGPIPNILCAEIFPTKVRGLCIGLCQATFWVGNILVTYTFPILVAKMGLAGVFGIFGVVCTVAWFFILNKVPETKGMPLEVISEFFAMSYGEAKKGM